MNIHCVSALYEFGRHTAEKMRVAVVPIRNQGMVEHDDFHAATSSARDGGFSAIEGELRSMQCR